MNAKNGSSAPLAGDEHADSTGITIGGVRQSQSFADERFARHWHEQGTPEACQRFQTGHQSEIVLALFGKIETGVEE
jgi:hypothetical protein